MLPRFVLLLTTLLLPWLGACGGGGGSGPTPPVPPVQPALDWSLRSDRLDGLAGTPFALQAGITSPSTAVSVRWDFGDGRQGAGASVVVSYPAPGAYTVRATAFGEAGELGSAALSLLVFEATPTTIAGTDIPLLQVPGDVDDDGTLTSLDVSLIQAHVAGARILAAGARRAADYEFDGDIDAADASLLGAAIAASGELPVRLSPAAGPRTSMVRIASRHLVDLAARVEVQVGQSARMPIRRLHPGYGLFVVPMDALGPPTLAPIAEGPVAVQVFVDGVVRDSVDFQLVNAPAIQGDEPAVFDAVATQLAMAAASLESSLAPQLQLFGASESDAQVLTAMVGYARSQFTSAADSIGQLVARMTPEQLDAFSFTCNANGLRSAEAAMQSAQAATLAAGFDGTGSTRVDVLFGLATLSSAAAHVDRILQVTWVAAAGLPALSSLVTRPAGLLPVAELSSIGASIASAGDVLAIVAATLPELASPLQIDVTPAALRTWHVRAYAPLEIADLCGVAGDFLRTAVQDLVMQRLSSRLTVLISFEGLTSIPFDLRTGALRPALVEFVRVALQSIGNVVDASGMFDAIGDLKDSICTGLLGQDRVALRGSELASLSFSPRNVGWQLAAPAAGTADPAVFTCDGSVSGTVNLAASLRVDAGFVTTLLEGSASFVCDKLPVPEMVPIAAGTFLMGSTASFPLGNVAEAPIHAVTITQPFWMGRFEVTQAEYQAAMGNVPSPFPGANRPVESVSWSQAVAYCDALTAQEAAADRLPVGYEYRLPTEAEWEYCCRAGTTTEWNVGGSLTCAQANFYDEYTGSFCVQQTAVVGSYAANGWGLHDMHGNVYEWCLDSWDGSANYPAGPVADPHVTSGPYRVFRGGSWFYYSTYCRSAHRSGFFPDFTYNFLGFRVVCAPVRP